jgi:hypothetical protein
LLSGFQCCMTLGHACFVKESKIIYFYKLSIIFTS